MTKEEIEAEIKRRQKVIADLENEIESLRISLFEFIEENCNSTILDDNDLPTIEQVRGIMRINLDA